MCGLGIGLATAGSGAGAGGASDVGGRPVAPAHEGFKHGGQLIRGRERHHVGECEGGGLNGMSMVGGVG
jgi:hypothetical protein